MRHFLPRKVVEGALSLASGCNKPDALLSAEASMSTIDVGIMADKGIITKDSNGDRGHHVRQARECCRHGEELGCQER